MAYSKLAYCSKWLSFETLTELNLTKKKKDEVDRMSSFKAIKILMRQNSTFLVNTKMTYFMREFTTN